MSTQDDAKPWEQLGELLREASQPEIEKLLASLPGNEVARAVSRLSPEDRANLLTRLAPDEAADLVEQLPDTQAAEIVEDLDPDAAARIVHELRSDDRADLIGDLPKEEAEAILSAMEPAEAAAVRSLAEYPRDVAGGLMVTEFLAFRERATVGRVISNLREKAREYSDYDIQYAYVVDRGGRLVGVLRMRDLLLSEERRGISELMIRDPLSLLDTATLDEVCEFFDGHDFLGVPVVDVEGVLLGVAHRASVDEARSELRERDSLRRQGIVGGEELRSMPLLLRSRRRLAWLSVNVALNLLAASVIAMHQDTLQAVIALAVFLPIISDMSGCSGNQAVAVSMRELTLGVVQPRDLLRVLSKEVGVGLVNGVALGMLVAAAAWLWKGNPYLGMVVGAALAINTVVAVCIGGTIPLILRRLGRDPALASGPVLTTVTDMFGFFLTLGLASAFLDALRT